MNGLDMIKKRGAGGEPRWVSDVVFVKQLRINTRTHTEKFYVLE